MRTAIKSFVLALVAIICVSIEASAQKISAAAVVDQHYAAQTATYKFMMLVLALAYGVYLALHMKRRREMNRFLGKI